MYKILYPLNDTTLYEFLPNLNSGVDQILEITKYAPGEAYLSATDNYAQWERPYNSRILIKFSDSDINEIASNEFYNPDTSKFYLNLMSSEARSLNTEYTIYAYPIAETWINGNGTYNDPKIVTNGASWLYRNSQIDGVRWDTGSFSSNSNVNNGGGTWFSEYEASQSFAFESPDIRMDITNIMNAWINQDIPNNGLILKHSNEAENDTVVYGSLKFFSRESHTIYLPRLESYLNSNFEYTGSFLQTPILNLTESLLYLKNLKSSYKTHEYSKIRIGCRSRYISNNYDRLLRNAPEFRLPDNTEYSIVDSVTNIPVVNFNENNKVKTDDLGNYIEVDFKNFLPVRYYKIIFKIEQDNSKVIIDENFSFKIEK